MLWNLRGSTEGFLTQMFQKASWDTSTGIAPRVQKSQDEPAMTGYSFLFVVLVRKWFAWIIFISHSVVS